MQTASFYTPNPHSEDRQRLEARSGWLSRERTLALALIAATALAFYLCYLLTRPLLPALAWALALAVVTAPLHQWIARRISSPNWAAALAVMVVALTVVAPTLLVMQRFVKEVAVGVEQLQLETAPQRWYAIVERNPQLAPVLQWLEANVDVRTEAKGVAAAVTSYLPSFVTGSVWALAGLLITLFILFYFFRDRWTALQALRSFVPLSEAETNDMFARVYDTIRAIIYGTLVVALVQGTLGGLIFWFLGLPAPLFWAVVMVFLALVPMLGTFVVWIPAAIFLALEGSWGKALILTAWSGIVIALIDNLLYPALVGQQLRLHTLPVFFAIIGGLALFGASGLILGPVILAVTVALVDIWRWRTAGGRTAESGVRG